MPSRPCLGAHGKPCPMASLTRQGSRCPTCQTRHRGTTTQRGYGQGWKTEAANTVAQHKADHGDWCPGYGVPPHQATDLCLDHNHATGARNGVLCRSCNSRKAATHDKQRRIRGV